MIDYSGKLYIIPIPISEGDINNSIPSNNINTIHLINEFIVEDIKIAIRFLKKIQHPIPLQEIVFHVLNEHTQTDDIIDYLQSAINGNSIGLMSDAGCPCVADPGAVIVELAHQFNLQVYPLVGPSSILLALMASGLNGQNFCFIGYLPVKPPFRAQKIKEIEKTSLSKHQTQIFIETPYRNQKLFEEILSICNPNTNLCIAFNIGASTQFIKTKTIETWKKNKINLGKEPAIFLLGN